MAGTRLLVFLLASLAFADNHDKTCSGGDNSFAHFDTESQKQKTVRNVATEGSCSIHRGGETKSMALLMGGHAQMVMASDSEDIFVSIKTTQKYHGTRLPPLLMTWLQTIRPEQVGVALSASIEARLVLKSY